MSNKTPFIALLALFATLCTSTPTPARAQENLPHAPKFTSPVDCIIGQDCWIVNYVDVDPTAEAKDFTCAQQSYDGHKGVDFALRSITEMNEGIDVRAALSGTILRVRDGEEDTIKSTKELESIKEALKECGNAVLIDHGPAGFLGLRTMYCHLKKDSIVVKPKDIVTSGQKIGQIGHSGLAEFPHLHFGTIWEGAVIDPFTGVNSDQGCGKMKAPMWSENANIEYKPASLYDAGFENKQPDFKAIEGGAAKPETISPASDALVFWAAFYGTQKGDEIHMEIRDSRGKLFVERTTTQEKSRARQYYYTGRRLKKITLPADTYTGTARLKRAGFKDITRSESIIVQ